MLNESLLYRCIYLKCVACVYATFTELYVKDVYNCNAMQLFLQLQSILF